MKTRSLALIALSASWGVLATRAVWLRPLAKVDRAPYLPWVANYPWYSGTDLRSSVGLFFAALLNVVIALCIAEVAKALLVRGAAGSKAAIAVAAYQVIAAVDGLHAAAPDWFQGFVRWAFLGGHLEGWMLSVEFEAFPVFSLVALFVLAVVLFRADPGRS